MKQDEKWGWWVCASTVFGFALISSEFRCFSVFYQPLMAEFNVEYESVSILVALFQVGYGTACIFVPILFKYLEYRPVVMGAGIISAFSIFLSSFAKTLWQVQVCCGLVSGMCLGGILIGNSTSLTRYFRKYRLLAMQIGSFGTSLGGLVFCPLYQFFINTYAWRGAWQLVAGVFLNSAVLGAFLRPIDLSMEEETTTSEKSHMRNTESEVTLKSNETEEETESVRFDGLDTERRNKLTSFNGLYKKWDLDLLINLDFYLYVFAWIAFATGFFTVPGFLVSFGKSIGFGSVDASVLASSFATGEIISRIFHAFVFTKLPKRFHYRAAAAAEAISSIFYFLLPFTTNYFVVSILCGLIGISLGGIDALLCLILVDLFDLDKYAASLGYSCVLSYFAGMGITILIGKAIDLSHNVATSLWIGGCALLLAGCLMFLLDYRLQQKISKQTSSL